MTEIIRSFIENIIFILQRLNWVNLIDLLLVTVVLFAILSLLRGTQAMVLLRGVLLVIALVGVLISFKVLPAFSWLVQTTLPALVLAIPVIFAPEIRRALERLGRAGSFLPSDRSRAPLRDSISVIVAASSRLASKRHGALIVLQRYDNLDEYIETGVQLNAKVSAEVLLQIFFPNTPLHDGAVIISGDDLIAASVVLPLSSSGVLTRAPERVVGLRHRAGLGITEVSDAIAVVISEETGQISVVHGGRMIRRVDSERLENILRTFFTRSKRRSWFYNLFTPKSVESEKSGEGEKDEI